ncbi:WhiB family transcriptional regulator [Streptomyces sp. NPDC057963]|uniref:WhiB family transcriptional regulator n=1 Tax=Streptomyces sp. NPDC057963 TaxID=3346290 RepID=UPI0036E18564
MSYAPDTLARPAEWRAKGACTSLLDLFFPVTEDVRSAEAARAVCARCPVRPRCLEEAMLEERSDDEHRRAGVRGGLTPAERARLARRIRNTPSGQETPLVSEVQARQVRTPAGVFADRTQALTDGHTGWTGSSPVTVHGQTYTPMQLAWEVTYGRRPDGSLTAGCGHKGCVTPDHLIIRGGAYKTAAGRAAASQNGQR